MPFVYIHIAWFGCWIGFGVEDYPYGLLTMIVSLEAIFLSTFVMISQNRADAKRQVIADQQWQTVKEEDRQNQELLELSHQILDLTKAIHAETPHRPHRHAPRPRRARACKHATPARSLVVVLDDAPIARRDRDACVAAFTRVGRPAWQQGTRPWQRFGIRRRAGFVVQLTATERR